MMGPDLEKRVDGARQVTLSSSRNFVTMQLCAKEHYHEEV